MREDDPSRFADELREPLVALPHYFGAQIPYDPRSRRLPFGPAVTLVRGSLVRLLRWWLLSALERQDHVNRLLVRAIEQLDERSPTAASTARSSWGRRCRCRSGTSLFCSVNCAARSRRERPSWSSSRTRTRCGSAPVRCGTTRAFAGPSRQVCTRRSSSSPDSRRPRCAPFARRAPAWRKTWRI